MAPPSSISWGWWSSIGDGVSDGVATRPHLQQVVYVGDPVVLGDGDLLDHLPGDGLQAGQRQQDLPEPGGQELWSGRREGEACAPAPGVVLPVADVVLQVHLDLVPETLDPVDVAEAPGVRVEEDNGLQMVRWGI